MLGPINVIIIAIVSVVIAAIVFITLQFSEIAPENSIVPSTIFTPSPTPSPLTFERLSINSIFSGTNSAKQFDGDPRIRTMIVTGDIIPVRMTNVKAIVYNDFLYPYRKTGHWVKNADITFGNLETPLMDACKPTREGMVFCGSSKHIAGLTFAGIDIVNLSNNHAGNHGESGLAETIRHLGPANIAYTGTGDVAVLEVRGKKFGFVGFSDIPGTCCGLRQATPEIIKQDVLKARAQADIVIAQFHWGTEYEEDPDPRVRELGKIAVDAGADLVIGNHPHWVQGMEYYKGKLITYAHGNYVFDQMWSTETRQGVLGKYYFYENDLVGIDYYPIVIDDYIQPRPATETEAQAILARMLRSSQKLENNP